MSHRSFWATKVNTSMMNSHMYRQLIEYICEHVCILKRLLSVIDGVAGRRTNKWPEMKGDCWKGPNWDEFMKVALCKYAACWIAVHRVNTQPSNTQFYFLLAISLQNVKFLPQIYKQQPVVAHGCSAPRALRLACRVGLGLPWPASTLTEANNIVHCDSKTTFWFFVVKFGETVRACNVNVLLPAFYSVTLQFPTFKICVHCILFNICTVVLTPQY